MEMALLKKEKQTEVGEREAKTGDGATTEKKRTKLIEKDRE